MSVYKNAQKWRSGESSATDRFSTASVQCASGSGGVSGLAASKYSSSISSGAGSSRIAKPSDFSSSKQKDSSSVPNGGICVTTNLTTTGSASLSRFSSSRSSLSSGSGGGVSSNDRNLTSMSKGGSSNSTRGETKEKSFTATSSGVCSIREKYNNNKSSEKSFGGSTTSLASTYREKHNANSSSSSSSATSASLKREKSNTSSIKTSKDNVTSQASTAFSEKSKQLLATLSSTETSSYRTANSFLRPSTAATASSINGPGCSSSSANSRPVSTETRSKLFPEKKTAQEITASIQPPTAFKIFTTKDIEKPAPIMTVAEPSIKPLGNSNAMTSSLRATARFGLRSGTSHAHYSSSLPVKPVEEIKPTTAKSKEKTVAPSGPKSWMSRGTSPDPMMDPTGTVKRAKFPSAISRDEVPTVSPNIDITIVVKHKECQYEEIRQTSIPKPRPSKLVYGSPNNSRFNSRASTPSDPNSESNEAGPLVTKKKVKENIIGSTEDLQRKGSVRLGSKESGSMQKRRGNASSPVAAQQCHGSKDQNTTAIKPQLLAVTTPTAGIVVSLPNKEFRKSALNINADSAPQEEDTVKKPIEKRKVGGFEASNGSCDTSKRPPIDPSNKLNGSQETCTAPAPSRLQKGGTINQSALAKFKTGKNLIPIRRNSTSSCSESESSASMSSTSASSSAKSCANSKRSNPDVKRVANQLLINDIAQSRRGSSTSNTSTSCSSAGSSRSSSSERQILRPGFQSSRSPSRSTDQLPTTGDAQQPAQSSYLFRALASSEDRLSWVRRCESGEIPWWMASSNKNIPGMLSKNSSTTTVIQRSPTTKQMPILEDGELPSDTAESGAVDMPVLVDKTEVTIHEPEEVVSLQSQSTSVQGLMPDTSELEAIFNAALSIESKGKSLKPSFIGDMTNIDDILGSFCPSPVPPLVPSEDDLSRPTKAAPGSTVINPPAGEIAGSSDEDSSDDDGEVGGDQVQIMAEDDDDDDSSDDGGSTGTSSSFEEIDPEALIIQSFETLNITIKKPEESSGHATMELAAEQVERETVQEALEQDDVELLGAAACVERKPSEAGLIPLSQREQLDDATLQLYKDGEFSTYLDLDASISEQQDEFEGFFSNRKNSIVLRAQLPVRVHAIIEKLLNSDGRELRRALFSLKQIFQEDKDLVHEFVENGGLSCLIKVGSDADQNYQNYILRAIGQVMLYVDGMYGVMRHNETIQWLYALVASKFRLVQKTALKLLLVFVDYVESNCLLLVQAVTTVDILKGCPVWSNVMTLLRENDSGDAELLVYGMTLVNKVLNGIPDIETYYDQVDALEEQGMASLIQKYMSKQCADLDLLQQFQIYEIVLKHEDGEEDNIMMHLDESMRQKLLNRKYGGDADGINKERRKSRRHSANGSPPSTQISNGLTYMNNNRRLSANGAGDHQNNHRTHVRRDSVEDWSSSPSSSHSSSPAPQSNPNDCSPILSNGYSKDKCISDDLDVTPGLRRRRDERQTLLIEQGNIVVNGKVDGFNKSNKNSHDSNSEESSSTDDSMGSPTTPSSPIRTPDVISLIPINRTPNNNNNNNNTICSKKEAQFSVSSNNEVNLTNGLSNGSVPNGNTNNSNNKRPWMLPTHPNNLINNVKNQINGEKETVIIEKDATESNSETGVVKRESTVKDLTQKLANQSLITSPVDDNKSFSRTGDLSGVVSKAKEGLAKSKSRADIKPPQQPEVTGSPQSGPNSNILEVKKSDNELHWDFLVSNLNRQLEVCDLDFTDLKDTDDVDILAPAPHLLNNGPPPMPNGLLPPPPVPNGFQLGPPPPPPAFRPGGIPPPPVFANGGSGLFGSRGPPAAPPLFGVSLKHNGAANGDSSSVSKIPKKTKKTVKLFWKEVREDPVTAMKIQKVGCLWDELAPIPIDTQKLEHLFESRAKDVITKKQTDMNKSKEIVVLDPKRSNAINIGMTKLPPPRTIKAAIMKMDSTIINREGIEKLLSMLPTEEERAKIQEAQFANPEIPLGSAEQFLLTLASISELSARLRLWAFKLDYENLEREVAEPLMDLKQGMEALEKNKTFRCILTTLLCIGNFLNGAESKGFQIDYLAKVPEVKDTVHKHSLLHHLCHIVIEKFPESTDLYSEIGPVTRASRVDFDEVAANLTKMETDCKASWDHLRVIAKHDGPTNLKLKMSEFLADCAERIIVLGIVHRRIMNRYHKFLLWLGVLAHQVTTTKPHGLFKTVSEFALEYRTTRERVIQQHQKKANHRERNKTRGKMITEQQVVGKNNKEDKADAELQKVLTTNGESSEGEVVRGALSWQRRTKAVPTNNNNIIYSNNNNHRSSTISNGHDGDDEILESLVKTATSTPATRAAPRDRKRNSRYSDRKSLRRTLRNGLSEEERVLLAAFMANGHTFK